MKKDGKKMKEEKSAFERIYDIIREIPEGKVASYGQVAELARNRRWARVGGPGPAGLWAAPWPGLRRGFPATGW